jgi:hypothetical protein
VDHEQVGGYALEFWDAIGLSKVRFRMLDLIARQETLGILASDSTASKESIGVFDW